MGKRVNTYDYLSPTIRKKDKENEFLKVMQAIDTALDEVADKTLVLSWDIENAPREELITMANSLGLFPQNFMLDDVLRRYIRLSGSIRELKGTDTLIEFLVDSLTKFKVESVVLDDTDHVKVNARLYYNTYKDFEYQQRILDFLIDKYKKLIHTYSVTYVSIIEAVWANIMKNKTSVKEQSLDIYFNFEPYVFGTPFNMMPMDSYNSTGIMETLSSTRNIITATNSIQGEIEDIEPSIALKDSHNVYLYPNWMVNTTESITKTDMLELLPSVEDKGTTKEKDTTYPTITGYPINLASTFKTPFELVTFL